MNWLCLCIIGLIIELGYGPYTKWNIYSLSKSTVYTIHIVEKKGLYLPLGLAQITLESKTWQNIISIDNILLNIFLFYVLLWKLMYLKKKE